MASPEALVAFAPDADARQAIERELREVRYLTELAAGSRADAIASARAVLSWGPSREFNPGELEQLGPGGLLQLLSAGVNHVPFERIPAEVTIASNAGAYSEPIAEHVLAMALALAKRLPQNHAGMRRGEFDQETDNLAIRGAVVGILGFGGIGQASAELFSALGARIYALNRSGLTDREVEFVGTVDELDRVLTAADVLVVSLPLTRASRGLIGARELSLMKPEAILVNVARAAIIDEDALYQHLVANPRFSAGIDTWWQEPREGGSFSPRLPLLELTNVLGSPHNSGMTPGALDHATRLAAENVARFLRGEPVHGVVDRTDYVD
jgi:phosphoglycerate dehydrogenase-like enzyme